MKKCLLASVVFLSTMLFVGCSNKQMMNQESGFLLKYDDLQDSKEMEGAKFYVAQGVDFSSYKNVYIAPVQILHNIAEDDLTSEQKTLFTQMQEYITNRYKSIIMGSNNYQLVDNKNLENTLVFEGAISAVELHEDDMGGMDFMPMMLVAKTVSSPFRDSNVRILGESRISDAKTNKVLVKTMRLNKGKKVSVSSNKLKFADVKPAIDKWLMGTQENLQKLKNSVAQG